MCGIIALCTNMFTEDHSVNKLNTKAVHLMNIKLPAIVGNCSDLLSLAVHKESEISTEKVIC